MRYGRLQVIGEEGKTRDKHECLCDCGNTAFVKLNSLRNGTTKSCGCLHKENTSARLRKHYGKLTPEYTSWQLMKDRCYNENSKAYSYYGGKGITVCDLWRESFLIFLVDMGKKPEESYTLDRIDGDKNYEPSNCRWASKTEQVRNRSNTQFVDYNGKIKPLAEWCDLLGLDYPNTNKRLWRGWNAVRAFEEKKRVRIS